MKALTVCVPYSHLLVAHKQLPPGVAPKKVENREWHTHHRGPLAIHAGKSRAWIGKTKDSELVEEFGELPTFGAVVGWVNMVACLHIDEIEAGKHDEQFPWLRTHEHAIGTWCWVMDEPKRLVVPIPMLGKQGFFKVEIPDGALTY